MNVYGEHFNHYKYVLCCLPHTKVWFLDVLCKIQRNIHVLMLFSFFHTSGKTWCTSMVGASIILSFCVGHFYSNNDRIIRLVLWKSSAANEDSGDAYVDTDETNQNDHICNVAADRRVGLSCMEPSLSSARSVQNVRLVCMLCICILFMGDIHL